jgi:hypothetical protein
MGLSLGLELVHDKGVNIGFSKTSGPEKPTIRSLRFR